MTSTHQSHTESPPGLTPGTNSAAAPLLVLVDGSGYIFRAYHALPPMTRQDGVVVNAVYGFTAMLWKLLDDKLGDHLAVIFDAGRLTFRNEIYPAYKANRPETPPELAPQFDLVRQATRALAVPAIELEDYEADDLIASYAQAAKQAGMRVQIISSDKDLMQLVDDQVELYDPLKNRRIAAPEVFEKFGVKPSQVVDVQALCGDTADNVPGVTGIGIKTAAELINRFGSLDAVLARVNEITQPKRRAALIEERDLALLSRQLVQLKNDCPLPMALTELRQQDFDPAILRQFLNEQDFKSLLRRLGGAATAGGATTEEGGSSIPPRDTPLNRKLDTPSYGTKSDDARTSSALAAAYLPDRSAYELIADEKNLQNWIDAAVEQGYLAIDTETTGLDTMVAELVGISLALAPGRAAYIPLAHALQAAANLDELALATTTLLPGQIPLARALALLKPLLADGSVLKIGHNLKYDSSIFANYGLELNPIDDTMLLSATLDGGKHTHSLDTLAKRHFDHETIKYDDVTGTGKNRLSFAQVPLEKARDYAAEDADVTLCLWHHLKPRLVSERAVTVYETLERPLVAVVMAMERAGILVDRQVLADLSVDFGTRMMGLEAECHTLVGRPFNLASPKQLGVILFDEMGLPGGKKGKSGDYSTDSSVLENFAEQGVVLAAKILDYRQLAKLKSTYSDALVEQINPKTGRVHTSFALAATTTGRLSSNDPNLQNIPIRTEEGRKIRSAFIAAPGNQVLSLDYSQIELRLLAEMADIPVLKQAFREGIDIHALTASQIFGIPLNELDKESRRRAKAINFGIIYGISAFGLANQLGVAQSDAKRFIDAYFLRYPGIRDYMEEAKKFAHDHGYVMTLFGRKCHIDGIKTAVGAKRGFAERQAINAPLQGSAADIVKHAMVKIPACLAAAGSRARMLLQVHDELVFELPADEIETTAPLLKKIMENAASLSIPLVVEYGAAQNWALAH
ncbi:MAG: DNA polymerase I [Candidatus Symbiobacter sp.]|nr:DNA polymerase I [Candidatus Symbiobacter sp.]